jgi:hypothetical protein
LRIDEVASVEARRLHGVSKLNAFSDGIRVLRTILREFRRVRVVRISPATSVVATLPAAVVEER